MTSDEAAGLRLATIEQDAAHLGLWTQAFEALCRAPVLLAPLDPCDPAAGQRLMFPPVFEPVELIGSTGHFRRSPALVEQVRRMGFAWDASERVMTVPAPGAFNARLAAIGLPAAGFPLCYSDGATQLGLWLLRYMGGVITLLLRPAAFYQALLRGDDAHQRERVRWELQSVAHDLSVHALNYHLVPHAAVADIAQRIRAAIPARCAGWSEPQSIAPLTLTYFYDNDFNRYVYAVWCRCERPEDFAPTLLAPRNYDQLVAALEVRLEETKAGRGDVASGDFDEVGPLRQTTFELVP